MYSPEEIERDRYERRQMAIRDDMARREDALKLGALAERIVLFESLLNRPTSGREAASSISSSNSSRATTWDRRTGISGCGKT